MKFTTCASGHANFGIPGAGSKFTKVAVVDAKYLEPNTEYEITLKKAEPPRHHRFKRYSTVSPRPAYCVDCMKHFPKIRAQDRKEVCPGPSCDECGQPLTETVTQ